MKLYRHVRDWQKSFFYRNDTSPTYQLSLPGFHENRLAYSSILNSWPGIEERKTLALVLEKIRALLAHGLSAISLIQYWVGWRVHPLSICSKLMSDYSGSGDSMRYTHIDYIMTELSRATNKLLCEPLELVNRVGLAPFWAKISLWR